MMKRIYYTYPVLLVWLVSTLLPQFCIAMPNEQKENNDVVIENAEMRLLISNDGKARSLDTQSYGRGMSDNKCRCTFMRYYPIPSLR